MTLTQAIHDQNPWWSASANQAIRRLPRRELEPVLFKQLQRAGDRRALVILGPRQVGKTTILLQLIGDLMGAGIAPDNIVYFDFKDDRLERGITPRNVLESIPDSQNGSPRFIFFDEVGSTPDWDRWLKNAVDRSPNKIIVTDSASSILRAGGRESGLGRRDEFFLETLTYREFLVLNGIVAANERDEVPDPYQSYLSIGGFPEHLRSIDFDEVRRRIRSDVVDKAIYRDLVRKNLDLLRVKDLFVYLVRESGSIFDAVARSRDLDADPRSVREWVDVLLETMLVYRLPAWTTRAAAQVRAKSKIFVADHIILAAFSMIPDPLGVDSSVRGDMYEAIVYRQLREIARTTTAEITYFRQSDDLEIDFLFETRDGIVAIEVTSATDVDKRKESRFLEASRLVESPARKIISKFIVYGGRFPNSSARVLHVPLRDFLINPIKYMNLES